MAMLLDKITTQWTWLRSRPTPSSVPPGARVQINWNHRTQICKTLISMQFDECFEPYQYQACHVRITTVGSIWSVSYSWQSLAIGSTLMEAIQSTRHYLANVMMNGCIQWVGV